ncbi:hypothetical protein AM232_22865 [Bacillus sp. FJAT-21352]|nr:hypothetical protein AM232_22865 [Bacillus sp. FJAT-21352]
MIPYGNVEQGYKTKVLRSYLSVQEQPERFVEVTAEGGGETLFPISIRLIGKKVHKRTIDWDKLSLKIYLI